MTVRALDACLGPYCIRCEILHRRKVPEHKRGALLCDQADSREPYRDNSLSSSCISSSSSSSSPFNDGASTLTIFSLASDPRLDVLAFVLAPGDWGDCMLCSDPLADISSARPSSKPGISGGEKHPNERVRLQLYFGIAWKPAPGLTVEVHDGVCLGVVAHVGSLYIEKQL